MVTVTRRADSIHAQDMVISLLQGSACNANVRVVSLNVQCWKL